MCVCVCVCVCVPGTYLCVQVLAIQKVLENIPTKAVSLSTTKPSLDGEKQYCPWAIAIDSSNSVSQGNF